MPGEITVAKDMSSSYPLLSWPLKRPFAGQRTVLFNEVLLFANRTIPFRVITRPTRLPQFRTLRAITSWFHASNPMVYFQKVYAKIVPDAKFSIDTVSDNKKLVGF